MSFCLLITLSWKAICKNKTVTKAYVTRTAVTLLHFAVDDACLVHKN